MSRGSCEPRENFAFDGCPSISDFTRNDRTNEIRKRDVVKLKERQWRDKISYRLTSLSIAH